MATSGVSDYGTQAVRTHTMMKSDLAAGPFLGLTVGAKNRVLFLRQNQKLHYCVFNKWQCGVWGI